MKWFGFTCEMPANIEKHVRSVEVYPYQKVREAQPGI